MDPGGKQRKRSVFSVLIVVVRGNVDFSSRRPSLEMWCVVRPVPGGVFVPSSSSSSSHHPPPQPKKKGLFFCRVRKKIPYLVAQRQLPVVEF